MVNRKVKVQFADRAGTVDEAVVIVTYDKWGFYGRFNATNLALWGCGKSAANIEGAVRNLVQDMGIVLWIGRVNQQAPDGEGD